MVRCAAAPAASNAIATRERFCILASFVSKSCFDDRGLMSLNQSICDEFTERGQERIRSFVRFDELDTNRQVFFLRETAFGRMHSVVRTKSGRRSNERRACNAPLPQEREDFVVQEIAASSRIFVQMDRYFFRHTCGQHPASSMSVGRAAKRIFTS